MQVFRRLRLSRQLLMPLAFAGLAVTDAGLAVVAHTRREAVGASRPRHRACSTTAMPARGRSPTSSA
jgi:hypothetical protein